MLGSSDRKRVASVCKRLVRLVFLVFLADLSMYVCKSRLEQLHAAPNPNMRLLLVPAVSVA